MSSDSRFTGFAIALAWPETFCKQPGSWYDSLMNKTGISVNHYYKAGHAALLLIDAETGKSHYFDFGRYHAPFGKGRVRSAFTDHGLATKVNPVISENGDEIENLSALLSELQNNEECHGDGRLHASYCRINFDKAFSKATKLQEMSPINYGPFKYKGNNCSRFVNDVISAGRPDFRIAFRLKYFVPLTPTPISNVKALGKTYIIEKMRHYNPFYPEKALPQKMLHSTLPQPERHPEIPENALWLSGEGAGSWFQISTFENQFQIKRYNKDGQKECEGVFKIKDDKTFNIELPYSFAHLSHCNQVKVIQNNVELDFILTEIIQS
jgi:hypothetical protein